MLLPSLPLCLLIMWRLAHVNSSKDDGFEGNGVKSDWVWVLRGAAGGEPPSYSIQASLLCHTTQDPTGEEVWVCVSWGWSREQMDNTAQSAMKPCLWSVFFKAEGPSELRIRQLLCPCPQVCGVCECLWCVCVCVLWKPPCRHPLYFMRKEVTELLRQWNISIFFPHQSVQLNYFLKIQVLIFLKELNRKNNPSLLTQLTPNIILEFTLYLNRLHVRSKWSHRKGKKAKTTTHSPHGLHLHCVHLQPHKKKSIFWIPRVICWQLERWLKFMFYKNFVLIIFII